MDLTGEQEDIVKSVGKPLLVLAGPGTGKTEVITWRVIHLLKEKLASQKEILGVTFTAKAAEQMRNRLLELELKTEEQPLICTTHSLAMRILKDAGKKADIPYEFIIADTYESLLVLRDAMYDVSANLPGRLDAYLREILRKIFLLKANKKQTNDVPDGFLKKVYTRYQELLRFHSALDFPDLILEVNNLLETDTKVKKFYQQRCKQLLIDEFQDMNKAEYSFIKLLADKGTGLFIVGDDKQSIYGWRGGDPKVILGFTKEYVQAIRKPMTICFRCPEKIIRGADQFIKRKPPLQPLSKDSTPIWILDCKSDAREADYISKWIDNAVRKKQYQYKDIAILYRGGDIADKIAQSLTEVKIPIERPSPEETKHVKEFIASLRLIIDRRDNLALRVCLASKLAKGIGDVAIKKLRDFAEANQRYLYDSLIMAQDDLSFKKWQEPIKSFNKLFQSLSAAASKLELPILLYKTAKLFGYEKEQRIVDSVKKSKSFTDGPSLFDFVQGIRGLKGVKSADPKDSSEQEVNAVLFITMHSVKGLQRKVIFVLGMEKGCFPQLNGDIEEQRRLFYVAMTRAKEQLFLCYAKKREGKSAHGYKFYDKSPFLFEIPQSYVKFVYPLETPI